MRYVRLIRTTDENTGSEGVILKGMPIDAIIEDGDPYVATSGLLIAHDLLEHESIKKIGGLWDELQALGSMWVVRGQHGRIGNQYHSAEESMAYEIGSLAGKLVNGYAYEDPPRHVPKHKNFEDYDWDFLNILDRSLKVAMSELSYDLGDDSKARRAKVTLIKLKEKVMDVLKHGAWLAEKRFKGHNVWWVFDRVSEAVDRIIKVAEFDGQEFILGYDFNGNTTWREVNPQW